MNKALRYITVAGAGAGLMYFLDPDRGKRRRALVVNKAKHAGCIAADAAGKTHRDVRNHLHGFVAELDSLFDSSKVTDEVLEARMRSKLGRFVSHPHAVHVTALDGLVTLAGPILADEFHPLLDAVRNIRGVVNINNRLEVHETAANVPALQNGRKRFGERTGPFKANWSPTTRLVITASGGALAIYGLWRRGLLGAAASTLGMGVVTRALSNLEAKSLVGVNGDARGIEIEKTINIDAGIDEVFTCWSHPENFPEFMTHVHEVRKIGEGVYRWTIGGPAGLSVEWDAQITDFEFNKLYAWKSLPGSMIQSGVTRFDSNADGSTRIDVKMSYLPPAGAIGHVIAELFGVDPKHEMDDDLMRMKSFIETRVHPHDAGRDVSAVEALPVI